jgi:dihydroxyacetone kinase-like protein
MQLADALVDQMLELILPDKPIVKGDEVCVLIDGFGSTTKMEQWIVMRHALRVLKEKGIKVHASVAGNFATCQEMAGFSITLLRLDAELKKYYDLPAWAPVYTNH